MRFSTTNWFVRTISISCFGLATLGCSLDAAVDVTGPPPPAPSTPTGSLTQRWSIGGQFDTRFCAVYGADRMSLVIRDNAGQVVARAFQPCEELRMTVTLATGSYSAEAVLITTDGTPVSTTLSLRPFQIVRNTETFVDTDFPISSLLSRYG